MRRSLALFALSLFLAACAVEVPYRADVIVAAPDGGAAGAEVASFSTDLTYFLVEARGDVLVRAVNKKTGEVAWGPVAVTAGNVLAIKRTGVKFGEVTAEEARLALGLK